MDNAKNDKNPTNANGAEIDRERMEKRVQIVRGVVITVLIAAAVLPALTAFVFVVALPASRLHRENAVRVQSSSVGSDADAKRTSADAAKSKAGSKPPTSDKAASKAGPAPASKGQGTVQPQQDPASLLRLDEAFWKARLELAKQEAISLAVDLVDSMVVLDIRGVPVRKCKIARIEISRAVPYMEKRPEFSSRLSKPYIVERETATLPKEPIRVEIAPKDTIEAMKAAQRPLAPEQVDVYFTMYLQGGLALGVRQLEEPSSGGARQKMAFDARERLAQAKKAVFNLRHSKLPQHEPWIELTLSREDAKAIYRALGPKAGVALRL